MDSRGRPTMKDITDEQIIKCIKMRACGETTLTPEEILAGEYPQKLVLAKMKRMVERGILDCGVSVRTAWIKKIRVPPLA